MRAVLIAAAVGVLGLAACGDDGDGEGGDDESELSLVAGACLDASDDDDILLVDCDDPSATARVLGAFQEGRCPAGSFGVETVQVVDGRQTPDLPGQACAKDLDDITQEDLDRIDDILNPQHFGLSIIGRATRLDDGPDPEVGGCLADGEEVAGSSAPVMIAVECDADDADWEILSENESSEPCDEEATAVATATSSARRFCIVDL